MICDDQHRLAMILTMINHIFWIFSWGFPKISDKTPWAGTCACCITRYDFVYVPRLGWSGLWKKHGRVNGWNELGCILSINSNHMYCIYIYNIIYICILYASPSYGHQIIGRVDWSKDLGKTWTQGSIEPREWTLATRLWTLWTPSASGTGLAHWHRFAEVI